MEVSRFLDIARAFERAKVDYVLVGGVVMNFHGIMRASEAVEFFIRPAADNVARLKRALRSLWDDPEIDEISAGDFAEAYPTLKYRPPEGGFVIDLLTRIGKMVRFEDLESQTLTVDGVPVRVVTPEALFRIKRGTVRPIVQEDAAAHERKSGIEEH